MKGKTSKTHLLIGYPSPRCLDCFMVSNSQAMCAQAVEKLKPRSRPGLLNAFGCELSF